MVVDMGLRAFKGVSKLMRPLLGTEMVVFAVAGIPDVVFCMQYGLRKPNITACIQCYQWVSLSQNGHYGNSLSVQRSLRTPRPFSDGRGGQQPRTNGSATAPAMGSVQPRSSVVRWRPAHRWRNPGRRAPAGGRVEGRGERMTEAAYTPVTHRHREDSAHTDPTPGKTTPAPIHTTPWTHQKSQLQRRPTRQEGKRNDR